ncbi:MAG TPA: malectin domain-containing carbohydrate-binding protein, partial [Flavobacteriaceae bacterium]|nr:malectin domain-containing carbohydrate-binding protein [Flavobacteriaceae bacterium]
YIILKNEGGPTDDVITVTNLNFTGTDSGLFSSDVSLPFNINPGFSVLVPINFISDASLGDKNATLEITHSGNNSPNLIELSAELTDAYVPVVRINTGGNSVTATDSGPDWEANPAGDGGIGESFVVDNGGGTFSIGSIDYTARDISIPDYIDQTTYEAIMVSQKNPTDSSSNMIYHISVPNGDYIVNYYGANLYNGTSLPGQRVFSVNMEDERRIDHLDLSDRFGNEVAGMIQHNVTVTDNTLDLEFIREIEAPAVNAIEILGLQYPEIEVDPIEDIISYDGDYLDFTVVASGGNPADNFTYSISGQPDGIIIEPTNGLVSGTIQSSAVIGGPNNDGVHIVTITVSKPGSLDVSIQFTWTVLETASVHDTFKNNISIFPNPVKDKLFIKTRNELSSNIKSLKFYSIEGKLVKDEKVETINDRITVDISKLRSAFYFMTITSDDAQQATYKILVK